MRAAAAAAGMAGAHKYCSRCAPLREGRSRARAPPLAPNGRSAPARAGVRLPSARTSAATEQKCAATSRSGPDGREARVAADTLVAGRYA